MSGGIDVPNPYGAKGKPDHQDKVQELADQLRQEAGPGETVITERKIQLDGSNRRPDAQLLDKDGKTIKVREAERRPESQRNKKREKEYDDLGLDHQTHKVGN